MRYADADTGKAHSFVMGGCLDKSKNGQRSSITNPIYSLLRKEQPKWAGFDMRPKGEVT